MANTMTEGSIVEVSSNEAGFNGAWYVATIIENIDPSSSTKTRTPNKKKLKKKPGYLVKYLSLLEKEGSDEPLTEIVDPSFVRPLPPRNVCRNVGENVKEAEVVEEEGEVEFEVNDVVDAFLRDGWWDGVVKRVVVDDEGEMRKYVVAFQNPYEELEFEKSKMRFHVDWVDSRWMVPPKKKPEEVLGDKNGSDDTHVSFTTPAKGTEVIEVEDVTIGPALSAKKNSRSRTRDDAQLGFTTPAKGAVVIDVDNVAHSPALSAKKNCRLRLRSEANADVDTSVTYSRSKRKVNSVEDGSGRKRVQSSAGGKGNTKAIVPVLETNGSDDIHQDSPPVEHSTNITQTRKADGGKSSQQKRKGRKPKLAVKKPVGLVEDGNDATSVDELPLSVMFQGMRPFSMLKRSSCVSPTDESRNQAVVANGVGVETTNNQQDWPFIKRAPIWVALESLDVYQNPPQKPHFSPLKQVQKDCREGLAIALMVTYGNLVQGLEDLQLSDPVDIINSSLETLSELETHGFDVGPMRGRFKELISLKSKVGPRKHRLKEVEKELEKCNHEKSEAEKEMDRLKAKMKELEEMTVKTAAVQKAKEEEIVGLQTDLDLVSKEINDWEAAFEKLCKKDLTLD